MDLASVLAGRRVLVTGGTGFLGRHVVAQLARTAAQPLPVGRQAGDLLHDFGVRRLFHGVAKSTLVMHLAYPGSKGITTSVRQPLSQQLAPIVRMDLNVIQACCEAPVSKLLCVGSVCGYPEHTTLPTDEAQLWSGYPEPVNAAYGLAKRMQIPFLAAARQEYGLHGIHLILANMYGPGDRSGHVIPSLIRRVRLALLTGGPVVVWGRPEVTRSFLYVEDAAEGLVRALLAYDSPEPLNLVPTGETAMRELIEAIARILGYTGAITFDASQPTGHVRRSFSTTRLRAALGWEPTTPFLDGLETTIRWHLDHVPLEEVR
jgi:GDP-L-fucose synthase